MVVWFLIYPMRSGKGMQRFLMPLRKKHAQWAGTPNSGMTTKPEITGFLSREKPRARFRKMLPVRFPEYHQHLQAGSIFS
jgi:hypothetical protein